ncbi:alpha/beta hydrolase [Leeuwenhoekiella sp. H156]|uniref:alpha/beta hydrolase n=1 Tax=Leeuwenhoekiella sp. H156 TaxID=3450128 RepID=UPI003FA44730
MKYLILLLAGFSLLVTTFESKDLQQNSDSRFYIDSIYSENLNEYRRHNIYLPKGFSKANSYPIVYGTDGQDNIENSYYKKILDSLVQNEIIEPIIFVQSHANKKDADSTSMTRGNGDKVYLKFRYFEYVETNSRDSLLKKRFNEHMSYFTEELIPAIESDFNKDLKSEERYFYGVSNGAGFGLSLLKTHPELIGTYLCFSPFGGEVSVEDWYNASSLPDLYFYYGSEEPQFLRDAAENLKGCYSGKEAKLEIKEYDGGHDYKIWNELFTQTVADIFRL